MVCLYGTNARMIPGRRGSCAAIAVRCRAGRKQQGHLQRPRGGWGHDMPRNTQHKYPRSWSPRERRVQQQDLISGGVPEAPLLSVLCDAAPTADAKDRSRDQSACGAMTYRETRSTSNCAVGRRVLKQFPTRAAMQHCPREQQPLHTSAEDVPVDEVPALDTGVPETKGKDEACDLQRKSLRVQRWTDRG